MEEPDASPVEDKSDYKPRVTIKLSSCTTKSVLENKNDVEEFIKKLRQQLLQTLEEGNRIHLK